MSYLVPSQSVPQRPGKTPTGGSVGIWNEQKMGPRSGGKKGEA